MGFGGAPPPFGIEGLNVETWADFRQGRVTEDNLTEMRPESLLIANNIIILADKMPTLRPGYTLVQKVGSGPVAAMFDYQRTVDNAQFLISQVADKLLQSKVDGSGGTPLTLSTGEDNTSPYTFVQGNPFGLYLANGKRNWALYDNAGTNQLYALGIEPPAAAPTIALAAGTLTTTYGWQWAYCFVRRITDGNGIARVHVGPPSPLSASSGPLTNQIPTLSGFSAPPDATWNFMWIFRTNDTPPDSTSALFFRAEIPVSQTTFTDGELDDALDLTRPIPYDNVAPPIAKIVLQYQSRMAFIGLENAPDLVQMGGFEEIPLGIPAETAPPDLVFQVPGGKRALSAGVATQDALYVSTEDFWFTVTGYNAATFHKSDNVCQPGAVGKKAVALTPTHLVYLGKDRKLYGWDMSSSRPINLSVNLGKPLLGSKSMDDISDAAVANAEVRWFSWGRYSFIVVLVNTGAVPAGQFDWIQLWNASFLGQLLPSDGVTIVGLIETDFWPSDILSASAIVGVGNRNFVFLGDPNGNIFRWPDGYQDNGKNYGACLGTPWTALRVFIGPMFHPISPTEVVKKLFFFDLHTDREDAANSFKLEAIVADSPDMTIWPVSVPLEPLYSSTGKGPVPAAARGHLHRTPGCTVGRWARFFVVFPGDGKPTTVARIGVSARPLYGVVP